MVVTLPKCKMDMIKNECLKLLEKPTCTIRTVASIIGLFISTFPAVEFGPLHYRQLERQKISALKNPCGNFDSIMVITDDMKKELRWWSENVHIQERIIDRGDPEFSIICNASLKGWGTIFQTQNINGRWSDKEQYFYINYLQLLAILFALKSFCRDCYSKYVQIVCDNTSAVVYINNMGWIKSHEMDFLASKIWQWCIDRKIWISCSYVAGDRFWF